ncbi:MAG: metallophosphoesterase [Actinobacteria bacterium]|nr:metallophosphoesterase [Actinomycetota bacterium]
MLWIIYMYAAIAALLAALYLYAFKYEPANFKLSEVDIFIKDNLKFKAGKNESDKPILTFLHLSDFHLRKNSKGKKLFKFVRNLSKLNVDFIFITGDLTENDKNIEYLISMLSPLKAKYGKYAVFGVHDHYNKALVEFIRNMFKKKKRYKRENDVTYMAKRLKDIGIEVLRNESRRINIGSYDIGDIEIIGLDDPIINKIDIVKAFSHIDHIDSLKLLKKSDYKNAYKNIFKLKEEKIHKINNRGKLRIILMHTPDTDSIIDLARKEVDIIFGGHTHGGQVRLPLVGAVISGCKIKTKFASGLFYFRNFVLYVTRGLGEGRYSQFRFYCQPEASLVKIYKAK